MSGAPAGARHGRGVLVRWSGRRPSGETGASTLDYIGTLALVVLLLGVVLAAYLANSGSISSRTASLVCQILTLGQGDCGGTTDDENRQPDEPCVLSSTGLGQAGTIAISYVELAGGRTFAVEERSDGSYRVTTEGNAGVAGTGGVGAQTSLTVADKTLSAGAVADVRAGVTFGAGMEWIVSSRAEVDQLTSADNWNRLDLAMTGVPRVGPLLPLARRALDIGEQYPPPDSWFVEGGPTLSAGAGAGFGVFTSGADVTMSRGHGYREDQAGNRTYYFESTVDAGASAEAEVLVLKDREPDSAAAGLSGQATVLTSITLDANKNVVSGSLSALAAGQSSGLTNMLFGGAGTVYGSDDVAGGTQWDATLPVRSDADRQAVIDMMVAAGISPMALGVQEINGDIASGPLAGHTFMDVVRERGDLTRHDVAMDDSTWFAVGGEIAADAKISGGFELTESNMTASDPQYWNGRSFADRTNC